MYVISTFEYSAYLEIAISEMELKGIAREKILAIPLEKRHKKRKLFDTINQSDGISFIDTAMILGSIFMLFGVIYGFVLRWGPILWGLIGLAFGVALGFIIDIIPKKKRQSITNKTKGTFADVVIIVECDTNWANEVENILNNNFALATGRMINK